ncbi:putative RF-2 protein [Mycobacterium phage Myrna]|uniref:RF-2 protein n=1 Tax=Mycobacterium phage Myrna TaxID=546805 RepID=B5LJ13_9CAUD|nr:gp2 [Mycobacterium phage Myrna]ACH62010.1 putative RF-2 protein [Mycobacterium phage Myrna]
MTPEDKIAVKLLVLIEGVADHKMDGHQRVGLATEIVGDIRELLEPEPEESLVREQDIRIDVYSDAVPNGAWSVKLTHIPTGIVYTANSTHHRSQLEAKATLIARLETKLRWRELEAKWVAEGVFGNDDH